MFKKTLGIGVAAALLGGSLTVGLGGAAAFAQEAPQPQTQLQDASEAEVLLQEVVETDAQPDGSEEIDSEGEGNSDGSGEQTEDSEDTYPEEGDDTYPEDEEETPTDPGAPSTPATPLYGLYFNVKPVNPKSGIDGYENGYTFEYSFTPGAQLTEPRAFSGKITYFRQVASKDNGTRTEIGSEDVQWNLVPGETIVHSPTWKDSYKLKVGETVTYYSEIAEYLKADEGSEPVLALPYRSDGHPVTLAVKTTKLNAPALSKDSTVIAGKNKTISISGQITAGANGLNREVWIQKYDPKKKVWSNYARANYDKTNGKFSYGFNKNSGAKTSFRVSVPSYFGYSALTTKSITVDRQLYVSPIRNFKAKTTKQKAGTSNYLTAAVSDANNAGQKVQLQKYDSRKKKWVNYGSAKKVTKGTMKFSLPTPSKKAKTSTTSWRLYVTANDFHKATSSGKINVKTVKR